MKADERFMAGRDAITFEIVVYLIAFFASIGVCSMAAHFNWSWDGAMRLLAAITGA